MISTPAAVLALSLGSSSGVRMVSWTAALADLLRLLPLWFFSCCRICLPGLLPGGVCLLFALFCRLLSALCYVLPALVWPAAPVELLLLHCCRFGLLSGWTLLPVASLDGSAPWCGRSPVVWPAAGSASGSVLAPAARPDLLQLLHSPGSSQDGWSALSARLVGWLGGLSPICCTDSASELPPGIRPTVSSWCRCYHVRLFGLMDGDPPGRGHGLTVPPSRNSRSASQGSRQILQEIYSPISPQAGYPHGYILPRFGRFVTRQHVRA